MKVCAFIFVVILSCLSFADENMSLENQFRNRSDAAYANQLRPLRHELRNKLGLQVFAVQGNPMDLNVEYLKLYNGDVCSEIITPMTPFNEDPEQKRIDYLCIDARSNVTLRKSFNWNHGRVE